MQKQKTYTVLAIIVLTLTVICAYTYAQPVHIPDPNLRGAIIEALNQDFGYKIKADDMLTLKALQASDRGINDLTGLQYAKNLTELSIGGNSISDLSPIADLVHLKTLSMPVNPISDLRPISNLTQLEYLDFGRCLVTDITPLAGLTALVHLECNSNAIVDVTPLAGLVALAVLDIQWNQINDHSALDALALSHFAYDQSCDMPTIPLYPRLENRTHPSIFTRWNRSPISNRPELSDLENLARHDLAWNVHPFGLRFSKHINGGSMVGPLDHAIQSRDEILALNPDMITLVDVGIRAAPLSWYPEDWPYWIRDEQGHIFREVGADGAIATHGLMDFTQTAVQDMIVQQAIAVSKCGLYDGIFFDYWSESWRVIGGWDGTRNYFAYSLEEEQLARNEIVQRIRRNTRQDFLIMGNTNDRIIPRTAPYINGGFLEMRSGLDLEEKIVVVRNSLLWLEQHLREPRTNAIEGASIPGQPPDSTLNLQWMRAFTTLSLTHSDGFLVFNDTDMGGHFWYDFWDADLGQPVGEKGQLYQDIEGLYIREFTNGWAVYNHSGSEQQITLPELAVAVASRLEATTHTLPDIDGEMYLRAKPKNPADVNGDGVVNIFDLTLVAQAMGTDKPEADVNGDTVVNVFDLVFVANQF